MLASLLSIALSLLVSQAPPAVQPSGTAEIAAFVEAIGTCTEAKAATPHPLMKSFTVEHTISGLQEAGCGYTQTMPGNMKIVCALSPEGRKALASEMSVYVKGGTIAGSTAAPLPTWWRECQLETADGKRSQMAAPARN